MPLFQFISLPMPPQVSHVNSSKIKNGVVPRPPYRQHNRPPIRGSPSATTVEPRRWHGSKRHRHRHARRSLRIEILGPWDRGRRWRKIAAGHLLLRRTVSLLRCSWWLECRQRALERATTLLALAHLVVAPRARCENGHKRFAEKVPALSAWVRRVMVLVARIQAFFFRDAVVLGVDQGLAVAQ